MVKALLLMLSFVAQDKVIPTDTLRRPSGGMTYMNRDTLIMTEPKTATRPAMTLKFVVFRDSVVRVAPLPRQRVPRSFEDMVRFTVDNLRYSATLKRGG